MRKLIYQGKTKDVYEIDEETSREYQVDKQRTVEFVFKDDVTGTNGIIDPGADTLMGKVEGKGYTSLMISNHFFKLLTNAGIPNHYITLTDRNTLLVRKVNPQLPFEFTCRYKTFGSFLRRYSKFKVDGKPVAYEGQSLEGRVEKSTALGGLVEPWFKGAKDELTVFDTLVELGFIKPHEEEEIKRLVKRVGQVIRDDLEKRKLELVDFKIELGRINDKLHVTDDISGDGMRVRDGEKFLTQIELYQKMGDYPL